LIKEALDKAQEEGDRPSDESHPDAEEVPEYPEEPADDREGETREISLSTVLASVAIVVLAALIGGQLVLLAAMFIF
jgi:hypothetical protein